MQLHSNISLFTIIIGVDIHVSVVSDVYVCVSFIRIIYYFKYLAHVVGISNIIRRSQDSNPEFLTSLRLKCVSQIARLPNQFFLSFRYLINWH
jgi:hypothetical protein